MLARINTLRDRIDSWFPAILFFFQSSPKKGRASRDFSRLSQLAFFSICQAIHDKTGQLWSGGFSVSLGGNLRLKGRSDNFHPLSLRALNPTEFQGDLISCKISGKPRTEVAHGYVVELLSRSSVDRVEVAELFRNSGDRGEHRSLEIVFIGKW